MFWEDKREPVIRQGVPKRTWSTFGSRAESVPAKRAPLCEKSHAISAFELGLRLHAKRASVLLSGSQPVGLAQVFADRVDDSGDARGMYT